MDKILEVRNLHTSFFTKAGEVKAVRGVSFDVYKNEIVGIVGESGSGKSVTSKSIMKLIKNPGKITEGSINFCGDDLTKLNDKKMQNIRGKEISMVFQDSMTALNPLIKIGNQITEVITRHTKLTKSEARKKAIQMLRIVGIAEPEKKIDCYPHEFSGGMRQRVCIAMAICLSPKLLIADEPTTALDVTIQAQILRLIKDINNTNKNSTIFITHDLGVVYNICDRVIVMYGGMIMEMGTVKDIFENAKHPYTIGLLNSVPRSNSKEDKRLPTIEGNPPNLLNAKTGCPFYDRCKFKIDKCKQEQEFTEISSTHKAQCSILTLNKI